MSSHREPSGAAILVLGGFLLGGGSAPLAALTPPGPSAGSHPREGDGARFGITRLATSPAWESIGGRYRITGHTTCDPLLTEIFGDGFESGDATAWNAPTGMPGGAVLFFEAVACPPGYSPLVDARGRTLVASPEGGLVGWSQGSPLGDLERRHHQHSLTLDFLTAATPEHVHRWATLESLLAWKSFDAQANTLYIFQWDNGIDNSGSGYYPFSAAPATSFYVQAGGSHLHGVTGTDWAGTQGGYLPYAQLVACQKD